MNNNLQKFWIKTFKNINNNYDKCYISPILDMSDKEDRAIYKEVEPLSENEEYTLVGYRRLIFDAEDVAYIKKQVERLAAIDTLLEDLNEPAI